MNGTDPTRSFHQTLARRLTRAALLAACFAPVTQALACGSTIVGDLNGEGGAGGGGDDGVGGNAEGTTSGGGVNTTSGGTKTTTSGGTTPNTYACFSWPMEDTPEGAPCPAKEEAVQYLSAAGYGGCGGFQVLSEATLEEDSCCYDLKVFECSATSGRPFLVDQRARTAALRVGALAATDWVEATAKARGPLSAEARHKIAEGWARDALMEHASVASFSRFALELLAVGAPAELVAAAHEAALDEVRHARMCFGLASRYAGQPLSPGAFSFGGPVEVASDLAVVAANTVKEGCVGETLAAAIAAEARDRATDPEARRVLGQIADDEARHAELAFHAVAWAIQSGGARVQESVRAAFAEALSAAASEEESLSDGLERELSDHGRLTGKALAMAARRALDEIVRPSAAALMPGRDAKCLLQVSVS